MKYQPRTDVEQPLADELRDIAGVLLKPEVELQTFTRLYAIPARLTDGMVCYFDVSVAGIGATGLYRYDGAAWNLLG